MSPVYVPYQGFAVVFSGIVLVQYVALLILALRRSRFRDPRAWTRTESVATHARFVEGPVLSVLCLIALGTGAAALAIGNPDYARVAGFLVALIRGGLFALGLWLAAWYWRQRRTWQ